MQTFTNSSVLSSPGVVWPEATTPPVCTDSSTFVFIWSETSWIASCTRPNSCWRRVNLSNSFVQSWHTGKLRNVDEWILSESHKNLNVFSCSCRNFIGEFNFSGGGKDVGSVQNMQGSVVVEVIMFRLNFNDHLSKLWDHVTSISIFNGEWWVSETKLSLKTTKWHLY